MASPRPNEPRNLQLQILRRWVPEEQIQELLKGYRENVRAGHAYDRGAWLKQKPTEQELEVLKLYIEKSEILVKELAKQVGWKYENFKATSLSTALRLLARHPKLREQILRDEKKLSE